MRLSSTNLKSHRHAVAYNKKTDATILYWLVWAGYLVSMSRADTVSVDKPCYQLDERILVNFNKDIDSNFVENWVAIYRQENLENLEDLSSVPAMWVWACGTQSCNTQSNMPTDGTVTFENNSQGETQNWPLDAGLYQAVLSGGDTPYSAHAVSKLFEIGCNGTPQADSVSVDKPCYQLDERILVNFNKDIDSNFVENWVAIYRQENLENLEDLSSIPAMWVWACGTQSCNTQSNMPTDGTVTFENNSQGETQNWPLDAGLYQAVLSGGDKPYSAHAVSKLFEIGCNSTPIPEEPTAAVDKSCYQAGETIEVSFSGAGAEIGEFVALYRTSVLNDLRFLPDLPDMWIPICGTEPPCPNVDEGIVSFANTGFQFRGNQIWPLDAGEYRAILSGGMIPFSAAAAAGPFRVGGCSPGSDEMAAVVEQARADIEGLIANNRLLIGKFLRLSFHDCVGGCDGE
jgi:hypothetical protein